jgi:cytidylate kinase
MADEQIRKSLARAWRPTPPRVEPAPGPIITVSRERGAGGAFVGRLVAQRLGFSFWDRDLLHRIAQEIGADEAALAAVDEHVHSPVAEFVESVLVGAEYTQSEYLRGLTRVVREIARRGSAVIIGRGAHLILGSERALRVRVVCPFPQRVARIAHKAGVSERVAAQRVRQADAETASFLRKHFHRDHDEPGSFDLVVNSSTLSATAAADLVGSAYAARFGPVLARDAPEWKMPA